VSDSRSNSKHLSKKEILSYLNANLSEKEMHRIERHLLSCDLCAEAMEGYEGLDSIENIEKDLVEIENRIQQKIRTEKSGKGFPFLRVAAIIIALIVSGVFITNYFKNDIGTKRFSQKKETENTKSKSGEDSIQTKKNIEEQVETKDEKEKKQSQSANPKIPETIEVADESEMIKSAYTLEDEIEEISTMEFSIELQENNKSFNTSAIEATENGVKGYAEMEKDQIEDVKIKMDSEKTISTTMAAPQMKRSAEIESYTVLQENTPEDQEIKNENAVPIIGTEAYNEYLEREVQFPIEAREKGIKGKVTIQFLLNEKAEMSHFEVKKGLGYGCDEEAIRLIKEGPGWKAAIKNGEAVSQTVKVKINFK
jgi:hypothetical protein